MPFDIHTTLKTNGIIPKTIAVMGPRPSELAGYDSHDPYIPIFTQLIEIISDLAAAGTKTVITDGSQGIASLAFWAVDSDAIRKTVALSNELYLPCEQQNAKWSDQGPFGNNYYRTMKKHADKLLYHTTLPVDAAYKDIAATFRGCDETIIDNSDLLMALYPSYDWMNDAKDETALSIKYALTKKKPVMQCLFDIPNGILTSQAVPLLNNKENLMNTPFNVTTNPHVMERENGSMYSYDLLSKLLRDRVIMVVDEINDNTAQLIVAQLHYLHSEDPDAPITMYINSPGGSVTAGMSIIDTMQFIGNPIITICMGMAASMGSLIFMMGTKGLRFIMPRATVMIHQPLGGAKGQATEIEIAAKNILKTKALINQMIADATGQDVDVVAADTERDNYKNAEESVEYGMADKIIHTFKESQGFVEEWVNAQN